MKPSTRTLLIAGIAIVAVALAAATLNATVVPDRQGPGGGGLFGEGDEGAFLPPDQSLDPPGESVSIPFLTEILTVGMVVALLITILSVYVYWREMIKLAFVFAALYVVAYLFIEALASSGLPEQLANLERGNGTLLGGGGSGEGARETTQPTPPTVYLLVLLGLLIIGTAVIVLRESGTPKPDTADEEADSTGPEAEAVGRAAGRAADRLTAESDVDNEVYRAWREMTELLEVDEPETTTPGEFATAAIDAGLGRSDVDELTRLFEDVRYGPIQPSEDLEERAISVFRRIEDRYGEEDGKT